MLVLEDFVGEQRRQQLVVVEQRIRVAPGTAYPVAFLQGQLQRIHRRLQAVELLVHQIVEIVGCFREGFGHFGLANLGLDLRPDRLQRRGLHRFDRIEANDVITVLRLDRSCDVADFHRECRFIEGPDHQPSAEETKIAAFFRGSRILGKFRREIAEFLRIPFRLLEQILALCLGLGLFFGAGSRGSRYQDVAGAAFFRGLKSALILHIEFLDLLVTDLDAALIGLQRQHHEFDLDPLGNQELALVLQVVLLCVGIGNFHLHAVVGRVEYDLADLPLLLANFQQPIRDRIRNESRAGINAAHLIEHDARAHLVFERGRSQSLSLQQLAIALARELA